jgi:hypothetical protein
VSLKVKAYAPGVTVDGITVDPEIAPAGLAVSAAGLVVSGMAVPPPVGTSEALTAAPAEKFVPEKLTDAPARAALVEVCPLMLETVTFGWPATVMLAEVGAPLAVQVPDSVPRPVTTVLRLYEVGSVTVTTPLVVGSVRLALRTTSGEGPEGSAPSPPLNGTVVVAPSPVTVAVPLMVRLEIATGRVWPLAGWVMVTVAEVPEAPVSGVLTVSVVF